MLFKDNMGNVLIYEEVELLHPKEIQDRGIHFCADC